MAFSAIIRNRSAAMAAGAGAQARFFSVSAISRQAAAVHSQAETAGPWADRPASSRLNRYVIFAEDYPDAGANARRLEVRDRHLEAAQKGKQVGRIELGGALLKKDFHEIDEELGPGVHMGGSMMVVLGESIEDVRNRVAQDEYMKGQVWDASRLKIFPFIQARLATPSAEAEASSGAEASRSTDPNVSLGQLRQDVAQGKGHTIVTLGALRKLHKRAAPPAAE